MASWCVNLPKLVTSFIKIIIIIIIGKKEGKEKFLNSNVKYLNMPQLMAMLAQGKEKPHVLFDQ